MRLQGAAPDRPKRTRILVINRLPTRRPRSSASAATSSTSTSSRSCGLSVAARSHTRPQARPHACQSLVTSHRAPAARVEYMELNLRIDWALQGTTPEVKAALEEVIAEEARAFSEAVRRRIAEQGVTRANKPSARARAPSRQPTRPATHEPLHGAERPLARWRRTPRSRLA